MLPRRVNLHSRIDLIFISSELNFASQKIKIIHFPFSDHDGIFLSLPKLGT
jgi:endonuclease/exonuclease/phosphatase family metal-dependent hydrolase